MKTKLLYALLFICSYSISQTLPTGHYGIFEFTNGSLENGSTSGGPDLTGNVISLGTDRNGNPDNTINSSQALTGHTLGAANYNNTTLSFWMKNTIIPLSIAFLDPEKTIFQISNLRPVKTYFEKN